MQWLSRTFLALIVAVAGPVYAEADPPARVGRLALIENEAFFRVDRNDPGGAATVNWPISSGAVLETGRRGRLEAWIGSTAYRLNDDSQVEFTVVDDTRVWVRVNGGSLAVSVLDRDQADDIVVATPEGDIRLQASGRYRIDVNDDHSTLTVQAGRAIFEERGRILPVAAGQVGVRWNDGRERLDTDWNSDAFDRWVASRENATLAGSARRYVSPQMTGYPDLDAYGDWQSAPEYGAVWYPRGVATDWAPYRYGRWAWVAPWGWTWIDAAPWGFTPFHYGRWAIIAGRWAWVPGRLVSRPVYAPALVAWVGNPGWSVSFSFGAAPAVGWFPLAPREVYVPVHRHSPTYIRQVNVTHIHDLQMIDRATHHDYRPQHAFRDLPRAVTVVPAQALREGRVISRDDYRHPERRELEAAPVARKPSGDWLAPTSRAQRSFDDDRRNLADRPQREWRRQENPLPAERLPGRNLREAVPTEDGRRERFRRSADPLPPMNAPAPPDEVLRQRMPNREFGRPESNGGPMRDENRRSSETSQRSEVGARAPDAQPTRRDQVSPESRREERHPELLRSPDGNSRRDVREVPRFERQPDMPQPTPQLAPQRELPRPAPEWRREERQPAPPISPVEREQRREMREIQRMERPQPAPMAVPQPAPQREMPRAMPEARMPSPQQAAPMPRMEAPRPAPPSDGGDRHRRRDDERGPR